MWRLESPERDADVCRARNLALALALGGDRTVVNPSRVLRLGGSIAWPAKPGRVLERTEFHLFDDDRPKVYLGEQLARAFPPQPAAAPKPDDLAAEGTRPSTAATPGLRIGSEFDGVSVDACLAAVRAGDHWHDNLVRLTGHWIARGWSDAEILTAAQALTLAGYTVDQTRREVAPMIAGGRAKWNIPNPEHALKDVVRTEVRITDWTADRYAGEPKPLHWLCTGTIPLGMPGMLAAMGGLGKSFLALDLALQIAAGVAGLEQPKAILGGRLAVDGSAVILTAEDSFDAIHRRLNRIDPENRRMRRPERLMVVPLADAGGPRPLIASDGNNLLRTPFFADLKRQLIAIGDLRVVVIDPLQAFVLADVNSKPDAAQFLWSTMAEICAATGATILVTHHMRKDGGFVIDSVDDAREAVRGTTALVYGGRFTYALWKAAEEEARTVCASAGMEFQTGAVIKGAIVKANEEADHSVRTYLREPSGLLRQLEAEIDIEAAETEPAVTLAKAREVLKEVQSRFDGGNPFSQAPNSGARYLIHFLVRQHGMRRAAAQNLLADWLNNGVVTIETCDRKTKLVGLKVVRWL